MRLIRPDVNVILMSAYSQEKALTELGGQKGWTFIRKPYQIDELLAVIDNAAVSAPPDPAGAP